MVMRTIDSLYFQVFYNVDIKFDYYGIQKKVEMLMCMQDIMCIHIHFLHSRLEKSTEYLRKVD